MTIHLIRHGHTEANAQKRYCGRTDIPLSPDGVARLLALGAQGIYPPACAFYTSGMLRARQTLALLYGDVEATPLWELAEYDFGAFEMRRHEELLPDAAYIAWISDEGGEVACPGGESRLLYAQRVTRGFAHLLADMGKKGLRSSAVVAHGGTIVHIMSSLFPDEKDFYAWQPLPGHGYTLRRGPNGFFTYQPIKGEESK